MENNVMRVIIVAVLLIAFSLQTSSEALVIKGPKGKCSRTCESRHCGWPPRLRYGKYCGVGYTGCPGEEPCDGLDACCQAHDACIGDNLGNYLNKKCNKELQRCVNEFERSGLPQFQGACSLRKVVTSIDLAMMIAIILEEEEAQLQKQNQAINANSSSDQWKM